MDLAKIVSSASLEPGTFEDQVSRLRQFFLTGQTRPYEFRRQQLIRLKEAILKNQEAIGDALYRDLKKSPEEAYATETGLVLAEINVTLRNLRTWMLPKRVSTNLVNLPSTSRIYRDPLGVVLIIAPWNYPFQLSLIPLVGAIAGGNCVLLKPSELASATAAIIEEIVMSAFSSDLVFVAQGDGAEVVPSLMGSGRFNHVFYTGGPSVGREVYKLAARDLTPVTLELGGKSPAVVCADAELSVTAKRIALGKFSNAGQTCVAPDYVLVDQKIRDRFVGELIETLRKFFGPESSDSDSYGKIINVKRFDKLASYLGQGRILFGGASNRSELFMEPTLMDDIPLDAPLMKEEIFGPILPIFTFEQMSDALNIILQNPDPLAFYIFSSDPSMQKEWIQSLSFGGGCINNCNWQFANPHMPFGGVGESGIGAYHGRYSFECFTHAKPILKTPTWIDPSIKYPPFTGKLKWFKRLIK